MPKKLLWKELFQRDFKYRAGMFNFLFLNYTATSTKSDKSNCTICDDEKNHKMETILCECKASECNSIEKCCVRYKIVHCLNS